jgi:hypothetical protein
VTTDETAAAATSAANQTATAAAGLTATSGAVTSLPDTGANAGTRSGSESASLLALIAVLTLISGFLVARRAAQTGR